MLIWCLYIPISAPCHSRKKRVRIRWENKGRGNPHHQHYDIPGAQYVPEVPEYHKREPFDEGVAYRACSFRGMTGCINKIVSISVVSHEHQPTIGCCSHAAYSVCTLGCGRIASSLTQAASFKSGYTVYPTERTSSTPPETRSGLLLSTGEFRIICCQPERVTVLFDHLAGADCHDARPVNQTTDTSFTKIQPLESYLNESSVHLLGFILCPIQDPHFVTFSSTVRFQSSAK